MSKTHKLMPIFVAFAAVVIIAGIILMSILGFNTKLESKTVEIDYDTVLVINEQEDALMELCEKSFEAQGLSYTDKTVSTEYSKDAFPGKTGSKRIRFTFCADTDDAALEKAILVIEEGAQAFVNADIVVSPVHTNREVKFYEADWRGGVALAVAAIVALIYVGVRYGVASGIAGLIATAVDSLMTIGFFAITRIPVYAYAPLLFAGIAAVVSVILWIVRCAKMRADFKDPSFAALSAKEAVSESCRMSNKYLLWFVVPLAAVIAIIGAVATTGAMLFFLPALIPLAVCLYSALFITPVVYVPLKARFDRMKAGRKRYVGKKKANAEE